MPPPASDQGNKVDQIGAIIVPTSRVSYPCQQGISVALQLGEELGCHVVFLCSGAARREELLIQGSIPLERKGFVHAISFDQIHSDWWNCAELPGQRPSGYDVARKRNVAISLAVAMGWKAILFLDDDIASGTSADSLSSANLLNASRWMLSEDAVAVGWTCVDFPDNSVICHARRLAGLDQMTFIGAGALLVKVNDETPFFPDMYNEDWFFLMMSAWRHPKALNAIGLAGTISQLPYDPYVEPRIKHQEKGDVLAECSMNLLEDREPPSVDVDFWRKALDSRGRHTAIVRMLLEWKWIRRSPRDAQPELRAIPWMREADIVRRQIAPEECARWVSDWWGHREIWFDHVRRIQATRLGLDAEATPSVDQIVELLRHGIGSGPMARSSEES